MKGLVKVLALTAAFVAASSTAALADTFNLTGYATYNVPTTTWNFCSPSAACPYTSTGDTGIFAPLNNGSATINPSTLTYGSGTTYITELFSVQNNGLTATFYATSDNPSYDANGFLDFSVPGYFALSTGQTYDTTIRMLTNGPQGSPVSFTVAGAVTPTPEPNSFALLGTGLLGAAVLLFMRRRAAGVV